MYFKLPKKTEFPPFIELYLKKEIYENNNGKLSEYPLGKGQGPNMPHTNQNAPKAKKL